MAWVTDQEDTPDSIESIARETWESINSRSGTLGVSLKNETLIRIAGQRGLDVVDDLVQQAILEMPTTIVTGQIIHHGCPRQNSG